MVQTSIMSRIYFMNILLVNLPNKEIDKLEKIQNTCIGVIFMLPKRTPTTSYLKELHWLPVRLRIRHKLLTLTYKSLHDEAPEYLKELLQVSDRPQRMKYCCLLKPNKNDGKFGKRSFMTVAPKEWNLLPAEIRNAPSVQAFKKRLKTYLFSKF